MTNISLDLSNKLPNQVLDVLQIVKNVADEMNFPILLVGAAARDLLLLPHKIGTQRATSDFDFGVAVETREEYESLKNYLIQNHSFRQELKMEHRIIDEESKLPIDLVPFGGVENPKGKIVWRSEFVMTTFGFEEAFETAINIKLSETLILKTVSQLGFVLLKIFAWNDRKENKDAQDLWIIVKNYLDLGNEELLYSENADLLDVEDFDLKIAGARILGRELRRYCNTESIEMIGSIIADEKRLQKLGLDINQFEPQLDNTFDQIMTTLESFRTGFNEVIN
jgi:predicted nucleotidyltransferase